MGGESFLLRPTMRAIDEIERELGCGITAVVNRFAGGTFGSRDVMAVLRAAIKAGGKAPPANLDDSVLEIGIVAAGEMIAPFLAAALYGGGIKKK